MRRLLLAAILATATPAGAATTINGDLARMADLGFRTNDEAALTVVRLAAGSPAAGAGLRDGDVVRSINGRDFRRAYEGGALLQRLKGGQPLKLSVSREGRTIDIAFTPPPLPLEDIAGRDTDYGVFRTSDGVRLRTIVSRPAGATGPMPAIFFTQWVSCGSLEARAGAAAGLRELASRTGVALIRVERAGSGDSEGPACHALDYDTEVRHYGEAFDALSRHAWIDPARIVIYGSSLGATVAPLVAQRRKVAGMLVQGGGAVSYIERMIGFDRNFLERSGVAPAEIDSRMRDLIAFQHDYLLRRRTPEQIADERPYLAGVWATVRGSGDGVHYGRPYAWHQQAAKRDFLAAWATIEAPVMVAYGGLDQFETRHGHELIVETVNRLRPGTATFLDVPNGDHELEVYPNAADAYAYRHGQAAPDLFIAPAAAWIRRVVGLK